MEKIKQHYHFNITKVEDDKIKEVMNFNFGGHHDLADLVNRALAVGNITEKHAKELVVGVRLLHHVLKKYPGNPIFAKFAPQLDEFKEALKAQVKQAESEKE